LNNQSAIEKEALTLLKAGKRQEAIDFLTKYSNQCGNEAVKTAWHTGDLLWTVFDGQW